MGESDPDNIESKEDMESMVADECISDIPYVKILKAMMIDKMDDEDEENKETVDEKKKSDSGNDEN